MSSRRPLHVGLNLHFLIEEAGGTRTYARELIRSLVAVEPDTRVTAFVTEQAPATFVEGDWDGDVRWVTLPGRVMNGPPWNAASSLWAQWMAQPMRARRRRIDVLHGLANTVAPVSPVPTVATVLDLIWLHYPGTMTARDTLGMQVVTRTS